MLQAIDEYNYSAVHAGVSLRAPPQAEASDLEMTVEAQRRAAADAAQHREADRLGVADRFAYRASHWRAA